MIEMSFWSVLFSIVYLVSFMFRFLLFCSDLFRLDSLPMFCSYLFRSVPFCSDLICSALRFHYVLFVFVPFRFLLSWSDLFHLISFTFLHFLFVPFCSDLFCLVSFIFPLFPFVLFPYLLFCSDLNSSV